jgi:metallo-beta-lactamase family protein
MAIEATEIFRKYSAEYDEDAERIMETGGDALQFDGLHYVKDMRESKSLTEKTGIVIIAGNGMATGGRIVEHLKINLPRQNSHVVFVGFQVPGTNGRKIVDGQNPVRIYGEEIQVQAKIHTLGGFSAHGDQRDLRYWLRGFGKMPQKVFMVHGDEPTVLAFASNIKQELGQETYVPSLYEEVELL